MLSDAYIQGRTANSLGYSIHYNPYRNLPADGRYGEWQEGWEAAEAERLDSKTPTQ